MVNRRGRLFQVGGAVVVLAGLAAMLLLPASVWAQNSNQFGGQSRADAAREMIILGVQQGITSLPPTSGQSFTYEFDPKLETYVASEHLGPTSFRSPQTVGDGKLSLRLSTSYFELADTKGPIPYLIEGINAPSQSPRQPIKGVVGLGLQADAKVGLVNIGANYGLGNRFEIMLNLPVVIVDAHASQLFTTTDPPSTPPSQVHLFGPACVATDPTCTTANLLSAYNSNVNTPNLPVRKNTFSDLGFDFNDGTHVGVGRISIGGKGVLFANEMVQVAAMPEFFFPSPSQSEFSGSDSAAILPRIVSAFRVADPLRLHLDAGYDYDFDHDELRRFVWNAGASVPLTGVTFDFGLGGSKFNSGIQWTPSVTRGAPTTTFPSGTTLTALADNKLGSNFIDALGGIKVRLTDRSVITGAVNVPLNNEGFRAAAVGTLGGEFYF